MRFMYNFMVTSVLLSKHSGRTEVGPTSTSAEQEMLNEALGAGSGDVEAPPPLVPEPVEDDPVE